jgi:hypothetical protein
MMWGNVGYSALAWLVIWAASRLVRVTGRAYFTMGIPIIVLAAFLIKSLTYRVPSGWYQDLTLASGMFLCSQSAVMFGLLTRRLRSFLSWYLLGIMTARVPHCKSRNTPF